MKKGTKLIPAFLLGCVILLYASPFLMLFIERGYRGEHRDLYTVAVHNIFAIYGYESNGEVSYDPDIQIIETDDYGRVLFFYSERYDGYTGDGVDYGMAVVIMQSSRDGYVWYYRDRCYMPCCVKTVQMERWKFCGWRTGHFRASSPDSVWRR
mgnify:CR=1 FL=1